ncbi:MAG: ABC transporter substrate-binding protein [Holosporales bacterium]|jgi:putative ABC transport system substrate-binding protein|nr:ABC transporter substrate-binding protein [Holosporales bacterium]
MNKILIVAIIGLVISVAVFHGFKKKDNLPIVAIANYGRHSTLDASIAGLKKELEEQGFIENKTVKYVIADVGFDQSLIPQMVTNLKNLKPKVIVVKSTPVAQFAKGKIKNIPLVFNDVTDPVEVGLIKDKTKPDGNMTGASDTQDLNVFLTFAKSILPGAKTVGILYSSSESNDIALIKKMREAAFRIGMAVIIVSIDQSRDIPIRMQELKGKADFIYVGVSGIIQPSLPVIAQEAKKMDIPVFNAGDQAVRDGLVLASFGINYESVGRNAGKLVSQLLKGMDVEKLSPIYPTIQNHFGVINKSQAEKYKVKIPKNTELA